MTALPPCNTWGVLVTSSPPSILEMIARSLLDHREVTATSHLGHCQIISLRWLTDYLLAISQPPIGDWEIVHWKWSNSCVCVCVCLRFILHFKFAEWPNVVRWTLLTDGVSQKESLPHPCCSTLVNASGGPRICVWTPRCMVKYSTKRSRWMSDDVCMDVWL